MMPTESNSPGDGASRSGPAEAASPTGANPMAAPAEAASPTGANPMAAPAEPASPTGANPMAAPAEPASPTGANPMAAPAEPASPAGGSPMAAPAEPASPAGGSPMAAPAEPASPAGESRSTVSRWRAVAWRRIVLVAKLSGLGVTLGALGALAYGERSWAIVVASAAFAVFWACAGYYFFTIFATFVVPKAMASGGPRNRVWGALAFWIAVQMSVLNWLPGVVSRFGVSMGAGMSAALAMVGPRLWRRLRSYAKEPSRLPFDNYLTPWGRPLELVGSSFIVATLLAEAALTSGALRPILQRLLGGISALNYTVGGFSLVSVLAISAGIVFSLLVTNALLAAFMDGIRDWDLPRSWQYVAACIPHAVAILLFVLLARAIPYGTVSTFGILVIMGLWSKHPPDVAFSRLRLVRVLLGSSRRGHFKRS